MRPLISLRDPLCKYWLENIFFLVGWTNLSLAKVKSLLEDKENTVQMKMKSVDLKIGGRYEPKECRSRHKVAIIVPYRDRRDHLTVFLRYLHPFLQRQQLNYVIIVMEQSGIIIDSVSNIPRKILCRKFLCVYSFLLV